MAVERSDVPQGMPRFQSISEFEDEASFRGRLGDVLRSYGFGVYFHDPGYGEQFRMRGAKGFPDMYLHTPHRYDWHTRFPRIAVEVKLAKRLDWVRQGGRQVAAYVADRLGATYEIRGLEAPRPSLYLFCTQDIWNLGILYNWRRPELQAMGPERAMVWLDGMTDTWNRFLNPDAAILLGGSKGAHFKIDIARSGERVARCDLAW